jgi:hypothetical protein
MPSIAINADVLKSFPFRLKAVAGVLAVELIILLGGYLILDDVMADRVTEVGQLRANLNQLRQKNAQLLQDLDRYPGLRQKYDAAMAAGLGNPLDRAGVVNVARVLSERYRMIDLHYRLTPDAGKPVGSPRFVVENDQVELESAAMLDTDVFEFWRGILAQQPGHYRIASFDLERIRDVDDSILVLIRHGSVPPMLRSRIDLVWTGIQPNLASTP